MEYNKGDIAKAKIIKINDNGCLFTLYQGKGQRGFMPKYLMPRSFFDKYGHFTKSIGDEINVLIYNINKESLILSDVDYYENKQRNKEAKAKHKQRVEDFVSEYEQGEEFKAEVIQVQDSKVLIYVRGDIHGIIKKEDVSWNEIDRLEDFLFEGEIINVKYIKHENGKLYFSLKLLKEKPYDEYLYDLSLSDLLKSIGHESNVFIGQAKQSGRYAFIENLYSCDENQKGRLLLDPIYGYNLKAVVINQYENQIIDGEYYKVKLSRLVDKKKRLERNQLFQFAAEIVCNVDNPFKKDVEDAFKKLTSPAGNVAIAHLLKEVVGNMLAAKDRMFFELVQNADDAASSKGVHIKVKTVDDFLIVSHNGLSFDKDDFDAIVSAANGTKITKENKTGYKGIGFKTVFKEANRVFIKTGGYQFKFDKSDSRFSDFDSFYFFVNDLKTKEQQQTFISDCVVERKKFKGVEDIPWQLEPIWIDMFPEQLGQSFTKSNVAIALEIGQHKIYEKDGYCQAIEKIIINPKFMLFLRNTNRIDFNDKSVSKTIEDGEIILKNSFDVNRLQHYKILDYKVNIKDIEERGLGFQQNIIEQNDDGKIINANFIDDAGLVIDNIPSKIALNESTTISFAIPVYDNGTFKPNETDISIFAFLPTLVKEFDFTVFVNANFLLTPDRQHILGDNPWNYFLMEELANKLVELAANLCLKKDSKALMVLKPKYFEYQTPDVKQLAEHFNSAYNSALKSEAFILNHNGELAKQKDIIIDRTGLSKIVGADLFCQLLETEKCLPSEKIDSKILEKDIFEYIEILEFDDVIKAITDNSDFNEWFVSSPDEQKKALYEWINNNTKTREDNLKSFVSNLPLFQFGKDYKSCEEIDSSEHIITTEHIEPIKEILSKLGFICSDNLFDEKHSLYKWIDLPKEEDLFYSIKDCDFSDLSADERTKLFFALADFDGVGDAKLGKEIAVFKNMNGEFKPLSEMVVNNNIEYPVWLNHYIIAKEEYNQSLDKYMISDEHVFQEIVQTHYSDLEYSSVLELYNHFRAQWTSSFTKTLIDRYGTTDDLFTIVERTDGAKHYFIEKYGRINLDNTTTADSIEYRLIQLALSCSFDINRLKELIYIDNKNITTFTIDPDVLIKIYGKDYHFQLSEIIENKSEDYTLFNRIKKLLSNIQGSEVLISLSRMNNSDILKQLNEIRTRRTPAQYAFIICYDIAYNGGGRNFKFTDEYFVNNILVYFFDNKIDVLNRYIQYFLDQKIIGCFINADEYTLETERLSPVIQRWADNEEKEKFIIALGAKGRQSDEIKRRKAFLNNDRIFLTYKNGIENEIEAFLNWCITLKTPFTKDNQVNILKEMFSYLKIQTEYDYNDYKYIGGEWDNKRYMEYTRYKIEINLVDGEMPKRGVYKGVHLFTEYVGDYRFMPKSNLFFSYPITHRLYINKNKNVETILMSVCDDGDIPFTKDDWTKIFMVSAETLTEKENEIIKKENRINCLEEENRKKDKIIEELQAKLKAYKKTEGISLVNPPTPTIKVGEHGGIGNKPQWEAQLEAQKRLIQEFPQWTFPSNYGEADDNGKPYNFSTIEIEDENDNTIPIVLKSYKKTSEPFKINTEEWDYLIREQAVLLIYTGTDIKRVYVRDLIRKQSSIAISFSTENLDIEDKVNAFADSLHYFNELHFDFDSFNISSRVQSAAELYKRNKRAFFANDNTEDEI